jgi:hypothetical protein
MYASLHPLRGLAGVYVKFHFQPQLDVVSETVSFGLACLFPLADLGFDYLSSRILFSSINSDDFASAGQVVVGAFFTYLFGLSHDVFDRERDVPLCIVLFTLDSNNIATLVTWYL